MLEKNKKSLHPYLPIINAIGVSKGFAVGSVWAFNPNTEQYSKIISKGYEIELSRFRNAQRKVVNNIEKLIEKTRAEIGEEESQIFEAHLLMVQDEELVNPILKALGHDQFSAEQAIEVSFAEQILIFENSDSDYLKERSLDLKDLKNQLHEILDPSKKTGLSHLPNPVILLADDLTPSQTMMMDRKNVLGLITSKGGQTSHTAIIARTLGIPAITGVHDLFETLDQSVQIAIDGEEGSVFQINDNEMKDYFTKKSIHQNYEKLEIQSFKGKTTSTNDGKSISLYGNIGSERDLESIESGDAEGVGLFRTEFLFMERQKAPTLEEQIKTYKTVLNQLAPKEVVIRTLDVGGDKPIPFIKIAKEENPFLGVRALRYCLKDIELFKTQIKAMLIANELGNLSIMVPMVSRASEMKQVKYIIDQCENELAQDDRYLKKPFKLGAMLEIPSLIFELRELRKYVSFISVGTNDLLQYSVAVDRMNFELHHLYHPYNLGFLRMMKLIAQFANEAELELSICGELGGIENFIPLWIGMGFKKLSLTPSEILSRRSLISRFNESQCKQLSIDVMNSSDEAEVHLHLSNFLINSGEKIS